MIRTGYGIPVRDGVGAGAAGKFFRRRRRRRRPLGVDPKNWVWSPKHITHVIFSRCIFSKILQKNVQTHLLGFIDYI